MNFVSADIIDPGFTSVPLVTPDIDMGFTMGSLGVLLIPTIILFAIFLTWIIICIRKMFKKAGLPGRGSIIPVYNIVLWFKLAGRSGTWALSILFPPLLLIMMIVTYFDIAKKFGKSGGFGVGLWLLNPIFMGILAFGKAEYQK